MTSATEVGANIPPGPLAGLRVLDLTRMIAGPYATKLMADYGADVIKIEQPGQGDPSRHIPPFFHDQVDAEASLHFLYLNTNKRSLTLDLKSERGHRIFLDLAAKADLVVENFRPAVRERLGIDWPTLHALNPRLVLTSISNFGQTGPYRDLPASELVEYGMSGVMTISGREDRSPLKHGLSQGQYDAGAYGAWVSGMMAFWQAKGAPGQWADISIMEVLSSTLVLNEPYYAWMGGIQGRRPPAGDGTGNGLSDIMPCKDGYVIIQHRNSEPWSNVVKMLDEPLLDDDRFRDNNGRMLNSEPLYEILVNALKDKTTAELFERAAANRVLFGIAQNPADIYACPHLSARGYFTEVNHPKTGPVLYPGAPVRMPGTEWAIRRHAPLLGQDTDEVLESELGIGAAERDALRAQKVI